MPKAYWLSLYREISDIDKWNAYAKIAIPVVEGMGAVFLARGIAALAHGEGIKERTLVIEFPSLEAALSAFNSPGYQASLKVLGDGCKRDLRIVEGSVTVEPS